MTYGALLNRATPGRIVLETWAVVGRCYGTPALLAIAAAARIE
jgi:hypothetical protein